MFLCVLRQSLAPPLHAADQSLHDEEPREGGHAQPASVRAMLNKYFMNLLLALFKHLHVYRIKCSDGSLCSIPRHFVAVCDTVSWFMAYCWREFCKVRSGPTPPQASYHFPETTRGSSPASATSHKQEACAHKGPFALRLLLLLCSRVTCTK